MKNIIIVLIFFSHQLFCQSIKELRAVKITNVDSNVLFSDQSISEAMDYLSSIGINAIMPVVWNGAYTQYQSTIMDSLFGVSIHPQFKGRDPLKRIIIEAHRVGIEVYPWFEYGFAAWYSGNNTTDGGPILRKFPNWALRTSDGKICNKNGFDWMSAINPEVQKFILSLIKEVVTKYDVDGIELSDRIPAMPVEGGYDSVTVSIYKSENGNKLPPTNYKDESWMRWRANKLNDWLYSVSDILKSIDKNLFLSSSPSIYPWSYQEYLQDSYSWIRSNKIDHLIPQLYRYSFNEYINELNNAINYAGSSNIHKLFSGILMNIGVGSNSYLISEDYLMKAIQTNREKNVKGEAFFYYEGLRKNNNQLGLFLKNKFYNYTAFVPERLIYPWRAPSIILNEDELSVVKSGEWETYPMKGFKGAILRTKSNNVKSEISYSFNISTQAFYDVYIYSVPNTIWTQNARVVIYSHIDSTEIIYDQSNMNLSGWQKFGTVYLKEGKQKVLKIDNSKIEQDKYLVADAVMIMLNRKKSPEVIVNIDMVEQEKEIPTEIKLYQNYPNPFNPKTIISYKLSKECYVNLSVYNILGQEIDVIINELQKPGYYNYEFRIRNSELSSGVYFYKLKVGNSNNSKYDFVQTKKMIYLK